MKSLAHTLLTFALCALLCTLATIVGVRPWEMLPAAVLTVAVVLCK